MSSRSTTADKAAESFMPAKVAHGATEFHDRDLASVSVGGLPKPMRDGPPSEDEELGVIWRVKPATAHQLKLKAADYAADVIRLRRAKGEHERACTYAAPIEAAMAGLPCPDPKRWEGVTDGIEDARQAEYEADKTKANLQALLRARASERQASLDLDRALVADAPKEWGVSL